MEAGPDLKQAVEAFQSGDLDRARSLAERAVEAQPTPQWRHLLGLIHCRLGDPGSGVEHLRAAAEGEPGNPVFQLMLVRALIDSGRGEDVLAMPEPPPVTSPASLALWQARAEAADAAGNSEVAAKAWSKVAAAAPNDWRALSNLGNARAAQGRWAEAAEALSRAAALSPQELALRRNAGSALARAGKAEEAVGHFRAVVAAQPADSEARISLASALASLHRHREAVEEFEAVRANSPDSLAAELGLGRSHFAQSHFADAEAAYRRALAMAPHDPEIVNELGLLLERTNQLEALKALLEESGGEADHALLRAMLARREGRLDEAREWLLKSDPDSDPVRWHGLRAKIADALGDADEAFEASAAMNRATRDYSASFVDFDEWRQRAADYRDGLRKAAAAISPQWAASVPRLPATEAAGPIFLVGLPRSGTTLLDTFLMGHSAFAVLEEEQLLVAARNVVGGIDRLPGIATPLLEQARSTYLRELSARVPDGFAGSVIDKFPLNMLEAPLIEALFPGAPILFAQRHPCDVVLSGFMQDFVPNLSMASFLDIEDAADFYDAVMTHWTSSREAMGLNVHDVVYEELVRDPEAALKPTLSFLGVDWDDRLLDHQRTARERGAIGTPSYDQVTEPLNERPVFRWKRFEKQLRPVLPVLLPWAQRLGYS